MALRRCCTWVSPHSSVCTCTPTSRTGWCDHDRMCHMAKSFALLHRWINTVFPPDTRCMRCCLQRCSRHMSLRRCGCSCRLRCWLRCPGLCLGCITQATFWWEAFLAYCSQRSVLLVLERCPSNWQPIGRAFWNSGRRNGGWCRRVRVRLTRAAIAIRVPQRSRIIL